MQEVEDDFKPFLQIIHISDLHVINPTSPNAVALRGRIRKLYGVSNGIMNYISDGTAPHDPLAVSLFKDFLKQLANDKQWSGCTTWLIDTGDLTSLGDEDSLALGWTHLREFANACPQFTAIYGNHDAWPGKFPLLAANRALVQQRQTLLAHQYTVALPQCPLRITIPHGYGEIQLYFADSIIHDPWPNTWALGEILDPQLAELQKCVDQNYKPGRHDLRILAVHHPVHYPPPRPGFKMAMRNDVKVAQVLDKPSPAGAYPLIHLVLSGHTHFLYPPHGQLPPQEIA